MNKNPKVEKKQLCEWTCKELQCAHTQKHQVRIQKGRDLAPGPFCCKRRDAPICWVRDGRLGGLQERRHSGFATRIDIDRHKSDTHARPVPEPGSGWEKPTYLRPGGGGRVRLTPTVPSRPDSPSMARAGGQPTGVGGCGFRHSIGDRRRSKGAEETGSTDVDTAPPILYGCSQEDR